MWIELSEFNFKLFLPLIFPIFKRIQDFSKKLYIKDSKDDETLFKTFRYYFSYIFAFIPLLIIYIRTKKSEKDLIEGKEEIIEKIEINETSTHSGYSDTLKMPNIKTDIKIDIKIDNGRKRRIKSVLFLGGLCIMALFCYFYRYFLEKYSSRKFKQSMGIFFDITGYIILSYLILKQKLYLHSYVTMGIISILLLILFIITIPYIEYKMDILKSLAYYFCFSSSFVLYDILKKKYMNMFFNTPYFMMVVIGIAGSSFVLIYDLFAFIVDRDNEEIAKGFQTYIIGVGEAFALILDLIIQCIWNLGIWLTIYYLTPCHYFMSEYIAEYIYYIKGIKENPNDSFYCTKNIVIFSIFAFVNFCCCLVFNEVIILNFCNLDYNTKKRIQERQRNESKTIIQAQRLLYNDENENIDLNSQ